MGKKTRKTRWRTLPIQDEQSDSEESNNSATNQRLPKSYHQKNSSSYLTSKNAYSSQSSPRRRYQYDSTRSSSTTSETKITFNEDEYTRITTPRQDVLFKKGYLSKPKTYQTQTSTGNSTTSTGNSTGNGTPDYQSTDLEYDSQFVFPGGFVDQNGIYYVNSYEPYPLMVYNPPTYYPEFTNSKTKRCSTGSLTESMSPNNDEASSQDLSQSGGEQSNNFPDFPVYNMVYPGYYINGLCPPQEIVNGHCHVATTANSETRRMKRRRRRKNSKDRESTSEYSCESSEENYPETEQKQASCGDKTPEDHHGDGDLEEEEEEPSQTISSTSTATSTTCTSPNSELEEKSSPKEKRLTNNTKYDLKPDAEEFVPRCFRPPTEFHSIPGVPGVPYVKLVNVPIHMLPNPAFIPLNYPVSYLPHYVPQNVKNDSEEWPKITEEVTNTNHQETTNEVNHQIDLKQIVSKLEEAKKEREEVKEVKEVEKSPVKVITNKATYRNNNNKYQKNNYGNKKYQHETSSPKRYHQYKQSPKHHQQEKESRQNYSEMVKKETPTPTLSRQSSKSSSIEESPKREVKSPMKTNQWISVSSKKKRKNKNVEEFEEFPEEIIEIIEEEKNTEQDLFEAYDVNELVDVVPPSKTEDLQSPTITKEEEEKTIEVILSNIATNETANLENNTVPVDIPKIEDIEKRIVENIVQTEEVVNVKEEVQEEEEEEMKVVKKKSKKNTQKPLTKRVIITDVDLSQDVKIEEPKKVNNKKEDVKPQSMKEPKKDEVIVEKKDKKKKKKKPKSSTITPEEDVKDQNDDSYEFLLQKPSIEESEDKTNVDMYQELDKMIQKGMYTNLEVKMKSMNVEKSDDFFKTVIGNISTNKDDKTSFNKVPDFTRILQSTRKLYTNPVSFKNNYNECSNIKKSSSSSSSDGVVSDSASGFFLENPDVEIITHDKTSTAIIDEENSSSKNHRPITEAVKTWIKETREKTPEIEILKSPEEIYKDFEEVVLFSKDNDQDDFWEDDPQHSVSCSDNIIKKHFSEDDEKIQTPTNPSNDDDDIPPYESHYGKNEDFLELKEEIKNSSSKNNNLPYHRAICCELM